MIKIKQGNILDCEEDIIVHQVNVQGIMGGGLARQLADHYPKLEREYSSFCKDVKYDYEKLSKVIYLFNGKNKSIANIFSQRKNFDTDYKVMEERLTYLEEYARSSNLSIAIPYKIGCGIANGDWNIVYKILQDIFDKSSVNCVIYKLEEEKI